MKGLSVIKNIPSCISKLHGNILPKYGRNSYIYTENKTKYLDYTSGIGALSIGHCNEYVNNSVICQLDKIIHVQQQIFKSHEPQLELTDKLINIMPSKNLDNIFYTTSGSESTENAIKIARRFTNKTNIISLRGGFHGRTLGAMAVSSSNTNTKYKSQPLVPGIFFCEPTIESFNNVLEYNTSVNETAGIIFEPVQGEGGIKDISKEFLKYVENVGKSNNMLLIADEVQCGSGRTGTWWNVEQKNINPDIMTFGKGIGGGYPIAGLATNSNIINSLNKGYLGGTYGGNPIVSIGASSTIDVINTLFKKNHINECISRFELGLNSIGKNHNDKIKEIRQYGLMIGIEIQSDKINAINIVNKLRDDYNILVLLAGSKNNIIRLLPPLNTKTEEIDLFIKCLDDILASN